MGFATTRGFGPDPGLTLIESFNDADFHLFNDFTNWTQTVVGSGNTTRTITYAQANGSNIKDSSAIVSAGIYLRSSSGVLLQQINWSKAVEIIFYGNFGYPGIVGDRYAYMRLDGGAIFGSMTANGVGFLFNRNGQVLTAESHNGTLRESTSLGNILNSEAIQRFKIKVTPGVSVKFYVNDSLKATHTTIVPTGSEACNIRIGAASGTSDNMGMTVDVNRIILQVAHGG